LQLVKNCLTEDKTNRHKQLFNEEAQLEKLLRLRKKRRGFINKRIEKINKAKELMQNVEPLYIDSFIAAYHRKGITHTNFIKKIDGLLLQNIGKTQQKYIENLLGFIFNWILKNILKKIN